VVTQGTQGAAPRWQLPIFVWEGAGRAGLGQRVNSRPGGSVFGSPGHRGSRANVSKAGGRPPLHGDTAPGFGRTRVLEKVWAVPRSDDNLMRVKLGRTGIIRSVDWWCNCGKVIESVVWQWERYVVP